MYSVLQFQSKSELDDAIARIPDVLRSNVSLIIDGSLLPHNARGEHWVLTVVDAVVQHVQSLNQPGRLVNIFVAAPGWIWSGAGVDRLWKAGGFLIPKTVEKLLVELRIKKPLQ